MPLISTIFLHKKPTIPNWPPLHCRNRRNANRNLALSSMPIFFCAVPGQKWHHVLKHFCGFEIKEDMRKWQNSHLPLSLGQVWQRVSRLELFLILFQWRQMATFHSSRIFWRTSEKIENQSSLSVTIFDLQQPNQFVKYAKNEHNGFKITYQKRCLKRKRIPFERNLKNVDIFSKTRKIRVKNASETS